MTEATSRPARGRAISIAGNKGNPAMASLTERLYDLIEAKPIGDSDLEAAALFTLDALANALAGRNSRPGRILQRFAEATNGDAGRLALLAGGLTHILETDDLHRASVVHPGCVVVPAAYAVARREGRSGRAFLTAVLKGFEACCRVGMAVGQQHYRIWHNTSTCGPYGSAYAAASLLGLDRQATVDALGNAGTQSFGLWQFLETGAMSKHLHAGRAAEAGLIAADLARHGFSGPPAILEGPKGFFAAACPDAKPDRVLADPAAPWQLRLTSIKPWPSCRHTHPAIDAALEIARARGNRAIERVRVATYQAAVDVCDRPAADSEYAAKFSLQHCVAAALHDGAVDFRSFDEAARARLADFCKRVTLEVVDPYKSAYPVAWGSAVEATLDDGQLISAARQHAKGDPEAALTAEEMTDKARMLLAYGRVPQADELIGIVLDLAGDGPLPALEPLLKAAA